MNNVKYFVLLLHLICCKPVKNSDNDVLSSKFLPEANLIKCNNKMNFDNELIYYSISPFKLKSGAFDLHYTPPESIKDRYRILGERIPNFSKMRFTKDKNDKWKSVDFPKFIIHFKIRKDNEIIFSIYDDFIKKNIPEENGGCKVEKCPSEKSPFSCWQETYLESDRIALKKTVALLRKEPRITNNERNRLLKDGTVYWNALTCQEGARGLDYYGQNFVDYETLVSEKISISEGNLRPADVLEMCLIESRKNSNINRFFLAMTVCHNVLKNAAITARGCEKVHYKNSKNIWDKTFVDKLIDLDLKVVEKLPNLRPIGDPHFKDKMGPWYHIFAVGGAAFMCGGFCAKGAIMLEKIQQDGPKDVVKEKIDDMAASLF